MFIKNDVHCNERIALKSIVLRVTALDRSMQATGCLLNHRRSRSLSECAQTSLSLWWAVNLLEQQWHISSAVASFRLFSNCPLPLADAITWLSFARSLGTVFTSWPRFADLISSAAATASAICPQFSATTTTTTTTTITMNVIIAKRRDLFLW